MPAQRLQVPRQTFAPPQAHGMVRPSFVPPPLIRELRDLTRYRKRQVDARAAEVQRLEKMLQDAGIKLSSVASEVLSTSGRHMIEALIAGQQDPATLAQLAIGRMRNKLPQLREALAGHFGAHHAVVAREILDHVDFLDARIAVISEQVALRHRPFEAVIKLLMAVPGISRISAEVLIAEVGLDMRPFPSAAHLASWAGLCPGNCQSAGKQKGGRTRKGNVRLCTALFEAAQATTRTTTYLRAQYHRPAARRGSQRATATVAPTRIWGPRTSTRATAPTPGLGSSPAWNNSATRCTSRRGWPPDPPASLRTFSCHLEEIVATPGPGCARRWRAG
jgi:transposase